MSSSKLNRPRIEDYVGIILSKYSYYHLIKKGKKWYEIKFIECLDLPPNAIFYPGRSFKKAVVHKNLVAKISKPIGPFYDAQSAWNHMGHGLGLGFKSIEALKYFMMNFGMV
jgi:hypothetical protein